MDNNDEYHCRVCGLFQDEDSPTWGPNDTCPSFEICVCCGAEFGFDDCSVRDVKAMREEWIDKGTPWDEPKCKPENWFLEEQLKNIPEGFR